MTIIVLSAAALLALLGYVGWVMHQTWKADPDALVWDGEDEHREYYRDCHGYTWDVTNRQAKGITLKIVTVQKERRS